MNRELSPQVYRHLHYHYHYDLSPGQSPDQFEKYSNKSTLAPQPNNHSFSSQTLGQNCYQKNSWKNYVNPQVTRLYDEMELNDSCQQTYTPKASRLSGPQSPTNQWSQIPYQTDGKSSRYSRQELWQEIQKYQQYLKKRSKPNLFVPNTTSLIKLGYKNADQIQRYESLKQLRFSLNNERNNPVQNRLYRTQSKIYSQKQCDSTTANEQNQHFNIRQSQIISSNDGIRNNYNLMSNQKGRSQIKPSQQNERESLTHRVKAQMSNIEGGELLSSQNNKYEQQQTSNFSLFQKEGKKYRQSLKGSVQSDANKDILKDSTKEAIGFKGQITESNQNKVHSSEQQSSLYRNQLIKQEGDYLRQKYIEHIQKLHKIKL